MICKRCGRNNPPNARNCVYCGLPLSGGANKSQKQSESVIVALILILLVLLLVVAGVFIYQNNNHRTLNFRSGGGGKSTGNVPERIITQTHYPQITPTPSPTATPTPTPTPEPTPQQKDNSQYYKKLEKKNYFLEKADEITIYAKTYLETAETQFEINSESATVYSKWDSLLNEVYAYLKMIMTDNEFERLQKDELSWIEEKENAIEEAGAEWSGGSGEPMARNMTAIQYTEERCYYLISLIN